MSLDTLREAIPGYAKDIKLNLGSVIGNSPLPQDQVWGAALACAVAAGEPRVLRAIASEASTRLKPEVIDAAKAAASVMAMNNVYYRAKHMLSGEEYQTMPPRLRMQVIGNPGVEKADFELWCLAVSAVNGCSGCLKAHEKALRSAGVPRESVHEALRIAAVVQATATTIAAERALADGPGADG